MTRSTTISTVCATQYAVARSSPSEWAAYRFFAKVSQMTSRAGVQESWHRGYELHMALRHGHQRSQPSSCSALQASTPGPPYAASRSLPQ